MTKPFRIKSLSSVAAITSLALFVATINVGTANALEEKNDVDSMNATQIAEEAKSALNALKIDGENPEAASELAVDLAIHDDESDSVSIDLSETFGSEFSIEIASEDIEQVSNDFAVLDNEHIGLKHAVQQLPGNITRIMSVADESYSDSTEHVYAYPVNLQEGQWLHQFSDGTVGILAKSDHTDIELSQEETLKVLSALLPEGESYSLDDIRQEALQYSDIPPGTKLLGLFSLPWAVDSAGTQLETSLQTDGSSIIQHVNTASAVFPVVADPVPLIPIILGTAARVLAPHIVRAFVAQAIRVGARATISGGYRTFNAFKNIYGTRAGYHWHHIVEQSTIRARGFDARWIHNKNNLVQIPAAVHQKCINSWMGKKGVRMFGAATGSHQTLRQWVHSQSFEKQHSIGVALLRHCGVNI